MGRRAVVVSGGPTHDFPATTACMVELLEERGLVAEVQENADAALRTLPGAALLVVNALQWTMASPGTPERYRVLAAAQGTSPPLEARVAFAAHLGAGDPTRASRRSRCSRCARRAVAGLADFTITDELYSDLDLARDLEPLLVADGQPLLWARESSGGRVVYDALGHHPSSYAVPEHREILRRAIRWAAGPEQAS